MNDDDDYGSVTDSTMSARLAVQDMFGNTEVQTKGDPVKGRRYLFFTIVMVLLLSFIVVMNTDENTLNDIAN